MHSRIPPPVRNRARFIGLAGAFGHHGPMRPQVGSAQHRFLLRYCIGTQQGSVNAFAGASYELRGIRQDIPNGL
jgi:hypothetical protein